MNCWTYVGLDAAVLAVLISRGSLRKRMLVERFALAVLLGLIACEVLCSPRTTTTITMVHKHCLTGEKLYVVGTFSHSYKNTDVIVDGEGE